MPWLMKKKRAEHQANETARIEKPANERESANLSKCVYTSV